jgi:hypothetical protein
LGPGASYDATGTWHFETTINGNVEAAFDTYVTQDANGNLHLVDEDGSPETFERVGTGVIIAYRVSGTSPESGCDAVRFSATPLLDTRANPNTITLTFRLTGCSQTEAVIVNGTRLS